MTINQAVACNLLTKFIRRGPRVRTQSSVRPALTSSSDANLTVCIELSVAKLVAMVFNFSIVFVIMHVMMRK